MIHSISAIFTLLLAVGSITLFCVGQIPLGGGLLAAFWLSLGLFLKTHPQLKGSFFTYCFLFSVTLGLFFPSWFIELNVNCPALGLHVQHFKWTATIVPALKIIMFGMGTQLTLGDFRGVLVQPKGVLVGVLSQFTIMPFLGLGLALLCGFLPESCGFTPEILAGVILVGSSPSGTASNVMTFIAKANIALSVTLTACTTLLAPFVTPFLMRHLASQFIEIDALKMMYEMLGLIVVPVAAGLIFRKILYFAGRNFMDRHQVSFRRIVQFFSCLSICSIVLFTTAIGRDSFLKVGPLLVVVCLVHNLLGYALGYYFARAVGMDERDRRTIALEVGLQNSGLATSIAVSLGKVATLGVAPSIFTMLMNTSGSLLASYWGTKPHACQINRNLGNSYERPQQSERS